MFDDEETNNKLKGKYIFMYIFIYVQVLQDTHQRNLSSNAPMDWYDYRCCLPRQHCVERKSWISIKNHSVPIIQLFGLQIALGNINFHEEKFRACSLSTDTQVPCS